jgi:hypothetical protein
MLLFLQTTCPDALPRTRIIMDDAAGDPASPMRPDTPFPGRSPG